MNTVMVVVCVPGVECKDNTTVMGAEDGTVVLLSVAGSTQGESNICIFQLSTAAQSYHYA